jgi:hypothetical protein
MELPACSFDQFARLLKNKTVALVYNYSDSVDPKTTWYDKWKSETVNLFASGAEALGAQARYIDVDAFIDFMAIKPSRLGHFIINLHSGLNSIASWPLIGSLASWRGIPIGPCPADVHIVAERKDVCLSVAETVGLRIPSRWEHSSEMSRVVFKPRDLGRSVGLIVTERPEEHAYLIEDGRYIAQEFVPGFDATIGLCVDPNLELKVMGACIYLPDGPNPQDWVYTTEAKEKRPSGRKVVRERVPVSQDLEAILKKVVRAIGISAVYRIDLRVDPSDGNEMPTKIEANNCTFLEANPTPLIDPRSSYFDMFSQYFARMAETQEKSEEIPVHLQSPQALLVAQILYTALSQFKAESGFSPVEDVRL